MNILIPWSGGLDSTFLVWKSLKEGHNVTIVYFTILNNDSKTIVEKTLREKLLTLFTNEFPGKITDSILDYEVKMYGSNGHHTLIQPPIWVLGLYGSVEKDIDRIYMSYILNDDCVSWLKEVKTLYRAYQPFLNIKLPPLEFPLIKMNKEMIWYELPSKYRSLVTSCEAPQIKIDNDETLEYELCGECVACKKNKYVFGSNQSIITSKALIKINKKTGELHEELKDESNLKFTEERVEPIEKLLNDVNYYTEQLKDTKEDSKRNILKVKDGLKEANKKLKKYGSNKATISETTEPRIKHHVGCRLSVSTVSSDSTEEEVTAFGTLFSKESLYKKKNIMSKQDILDKKVRFLPEKIKEPEES